METASETETQYIQVLNDIFRSSGRGVRITHGAFELEDVEGLMKAIRWYTDFNSNNDPYKQHDFGSLKWKGQKVFWIIEYYDENLMYWRNPLSEKCRRVLTVMLASEY